MFPLPEGLKNKMLADANLEASEDIQSLSPEINRGQTIISIEMPGNTKEIEKQYNWYTDWLCYTNDCLLFICCVSDDGQAWFIKKFDNLQGKNPDVFKYQNDMLQNAKNCNPESYHYFIGECSTKKLKDDKALIKILPEGKITESNKFKDYEVPVNLDEFKKIIKDYCKYKYENPCGKY